SRIPGLVAGGTQDNGNIFCYRGGHRPWWFKMEGGDGALNRIVDTLGTGPLLLFNNGRTRVRIAFWDPTSHSSGHDFGRVVPVEGAPSGLPSPQLEVVQSPSWRRDGQLMYAVAAARGDAGTVYGLFSGADGSDARFTRLADVGVPVSALDSRDGT